MGIIIAGLNINIVDCFLLVRPIVTGLRATQNWGHCLRDLRMQKSALNLIQLFPRGIPEKVLSNFS